jgi:hypothetical protein
VGQVEVTHLQEANGRLLEAPLTRVARHSVLQPHLSTPQARYVQAKLSVHDRSLKVATVIESLEMEMELLCLTGVEDQLQADVRPTLETLRNAGIKVGLPVTQSSARAGSRGKTFSKTLRVEGQSWYCTAASQHMGVSGRISSSGPAWDKAKK